MAGPTLKYDISVVGMEKIERALSHIESRVREHNLRLVRNTGGPAGSTRSQNPAVAEAASRRALQREEAEAKRSAERAAAAATRAHEKSERDQTRATARELKERERLEAQSQAYQRRLKDQHNREGFRKERDQARQNEQAVARSRAQWRSNVTGVMGNVGSSLSAVGRAGMTLAGVAGGAIFANATHTYLKDSGQATALAAQMATTGESTASIRDRRRGIITNAEGIKGFSTAEAIDAQRTFGGKAGDYAMGGKLLGGLSKVSLATGVGLNDVSDVAANAYMKLSKTMKGTDLEQATMDMVRTFAGQGNVGAVEIKDLAQHAGIITSAAAGYSGDRRKNMSTLGAMAQISIGSGAAASAAEAATTVARFSGDLIKNSDDAKKMGIDIFSDSTRTKKRGPQELILDVLEKTKGDQVKLKKLFGLESIKLMEGLTDIYVQGEKGGKGGGRKAISAEFDKFDRATLTEKDAEARAAARLADEDMQVAENMKHLNTAIGKELAPALTTLIGKVADAAPQLGRLAEVTSQAVAFFGKNPFTSLGLLISATVTKSILAAGIGNAIRNVILGIGSSGAAGGVGSAAGGLARAGAGAAGIGAGGVGLIAAAGVGAGLATYGYLEATDTSNATGKQLSELDLTAYNRRNAVDRDPNLSPEQKARKKLAMLDETESKVSEIEKGRSYSTWLGGGGVQQIGEMREGIAKDREIAQEQLSAAQALQEATAAFRDMVQQSPLTGQPSRASDVYDNWGR